MALDQVREHGWQLPPAVRPYGDPTADTRR